MNLCFVGVVTGLKCEGYRMNIIHPVPTFDNMTAFAEVNIDLQRLNGRVADRVL
jgi:hypothetical protein